MKVVIIGATGLTGRALTSQLLADPQVENVVVILRKPLAVEHPKLKQAIVDFEAEESLRSHLRGNVLFCCIGSTIAKAGTKEQFYKVDHDIPVRCATLAAENGIDTMVLISSIGADARAGNFYLRTKGQVEESLEKLSFRALHIFQPGVLMGRRQESRPLERLAIILSPLINLLLWGPLMKYRGIDVNQLVQAMINAAKRPLAGVRRYTWRDIRGG